MTTIKHLYNKWLNLQPLKADDQNRLNQKFMLEFNYNSNHMEGNTLTYGQTELLLLFGKVLDAANMKDLEDMKASNVGLNMMKEQASSNFPLTETFIRQLHHTILREDYTVYRQLPGGKQTSYIVHAGVYKTRPNSVITSTGERFEYASPEETPALMNNLIQWYNHEEQKAKLTPAELCALFHYRYIRIHPFEDGNGRIARLLVNFILARHNYPMIVLKTTDKNNYLNALNACDKQVGTIPSMAAYATLEQIQPFVEYIEKCIIETLIMCIKAAKGESIEEDDDFLKELRIAQRMKKQHNAEETSLKQKCSTEIWNVIEYVYQPIANDLCRAIDTANQAFQFATVNKVNTLSKTKDTENGIQLNQIIRNTTNNKINDFIENAESIWFSCKMMAPQEPYKPNFKIEKAFYIAFFDDHYFVDGILNKNFAYGTYPSENEKQKIVSQFKKDIIEEINQNM